MITCPLLKDGKNPRKQLSMVTISSRQSPNMSSLPSVRAMSHSRRIHSLNRKYCRGGDGSYTTHRPAISRIFTSSVYQYDTCMLGRAARTPPIQEDAYLASEAMVLLDREEHPSYSFAQAA